MIQLVHLPRRRGNVPLRIARGHFATNHSHINYYIDITYNKTRVSEAKASAQELVDYCKSRNLPLVAATTGYTPEEFAILEEGAKTVPVFQSYNMSVGVALLARLVKQAAAIFGGCDVEIIEAHHNRKADAPSGTALLLADAVKEKRPDAEYVFGRSGQHKRQPNEIGIHALRMGNVVGEHEVIFATDNQTISLKHQAHDRALFADGAIAAARFIVTQAPGFYHMDDLLGP